MIFQATQVFPTAQTSGLLPQSWGYHPSAFPQFSLPDNAAIFTAQPPYKQQGGSGTRGGHNQYKARRGRGGLASDRGQQSDQQRGNGYPNQSGHGAFQQVSYGSGNPQQQHPQSAPSPPTQYNSFYGYNAGGQQGRQQSSGRPSLDGGNLKKYPSNGPVSLPVASNSPQYQPQVKLCQILTLPQLSHIQ